MYYLNKYSLFSYQLPDDVKNAVDSFRQFLVDGGVDISQVYLAGGICRDAYLKTGKPIKDIDVFFLDFDVYEGTMALVDNTIPVEETKDTLEGSLLFSRTIPFAGFTFDLVDRSFEDMFSLLNLLETFDFDICQIGFALSDEIASVVGNNQVDPSRVKILNCDTPARTAKRIERYESDYGITFDPQSRRDFYNYLHTLEKHNLLGE